MGFFHDKEFLGSLAILARKDISSYLGIIEQVMNLAIMAIERKRAEDEVEKNEKRFQALIEHGRDNISLLAADGTLLWENPLASSTLGYELNQHIGEKISNSSIQTIREWAREMFGQVLQLPGKYSGGEIRILHSDGTWRWIQSSAINLLENPNVQAIVLNYRDITERKLAEEDLLKPTSGRKVSSKALVQLHGNGMFKPGRPFSMKCGRNSSVIHWMNWLRSASKLGKLLPTRMTSHDPVNLLSSISRVSCRIMNANVE